MNNNDKTDVGQEQDPPSYRNDEPDFEDSREVDAPEPKSRPEPSRDISSYLPSAPSAPVALTDAISSVSGAVSQGADKLNEVKDNYGIMIIVGLALAIMLFILAYFLYIYLTQKITQKIIYELPESSIPKKCNVVNKLSGLMLPPNVNGNRSTFMFWLYINDINMLSGDELRHIIHIGDETTKGASPTVYLDGMKNRLYIRFAKDTDKSGVPSFSGTGPTDLAEQIKRGLDYKFTTPPTDNEYTSLLGNVSITNPLDAIKTDLATHGVVVDYVPLQRWVHVAIVVNESVNRGYITTYLDGEIVSSVSSNDKVVLSNGKSLDVDFTGLNLSKKGDVFIGGDIYNNNISRGFAGLVSRVTVANFDMNGTEVKKIFYKGPLDSITNNMGIQGYGVRNPIYKVDE